MSKEFNIQREADKVGRSFVERKFEETFNELEKEQHGRGCGCASCAKRVVNNANSWADFVSKGTNVFEYILEWRKGKPKIKIKEK